jgi:hypothetical protein
MPEEIGSEELNEALAGVVETQNNIGEETSDVDLAESSEGESDSIYKISSRNAGDC